MKLIRMHWRSRIDGAILSKHKLYVVPSSVIERARLFFKGYRRHRLEVTGLRMAEAWSHRRHLAIHEILSGK